MEYGRSYDDLSPVQARRLLADKIESWVSGETDNFELDDDVFDFLSLQATSEIASAVWGCYDDFKVHRPSRVTTAFLSRCAAFLRSGLEVAPMAEVPVFFGLFRRKHAPPYWPFESQAQWRAYRELSTIIVPAFSSEELSLVVRFHRKIRHRSRARRFRAVGKV